MDAGEYAVVVSGLSLPPIYKYGAVQEEDDDVLPILTNFGRGLVASRCLVIFLCTCMCMCTGI